MCGIVGYVGSKRSADYVLDGLRRLEYRGYDSAGIATIDEGKIRLRRKKGKLRELDELLRNEPLAGEIAIGHTRWATHGRPSDENAHPHHVGDVVLVHNGIIENYLALREELGKAGSTFESDTDTEIIAHLVAAAKGATLAERVRTALERVEGAYAIAVISEMEPNTIVVAKNASPLIIGVLADAGVIASDIPALLPYTREIKILEEGEVATIRPGSVEITDLKGEPVDRPSRIIDWSPVMAEKGGHKHFMHKEIFEQPRAVTDTLRGRLGASGNDVELDQALVKKVAEASRVMLTACGTSYHACLVGRLALEELARMGCDVELASELRYRHPLLGPETAILAISQSGETADTLAAIKAARELGSPVVSVVNVIDSSISRESDWVLYTHAGPEIGVASTKAFVTQVVAMYLLAIGVARHRGLDATRSSELITGLRQMPLHIETVLQQESRIIEIAQRFKHVSSSLYLGRGFGYPVALEGALKLKEISYIHAEGYAAGEMKHGPIALIEPEVPVVVVATAGAVYDKVLANIQEVKAREGVVIAIATAGDRTIESLVDEVVYVPDVDPVFAPIVTTVPLQLLAYHVADLRGTDIDQPRNLAKSVTVE
ncbi:MAG: glutamine--fructose-6-phosphate aminotransferase [Deltaproteobacteria bacterium RIFOXYA12_FULL_58_15]|nr:MAG: glutamine--fructose-6-phosphate aminotransferase [Deltaproteobacteria bacterium RIFOXYA12_FULL_58_15]